MRDTLAALASAPSGSVLVFSYVRRDFLDGVELYGDEPTDRRFVRPGIWRFGLNPPDVAALGAEYGWHEQDQADDTEFRTRYLAPYAAPTRLPYSNAASPPPSPDLKSLSAV